MNICYVICIDFKVVLSIHLIPMGCQTSYTQPSKQQLALRFKKLKFQLELDMKN